MTVFDVFFEDGVGLIGLINGGECRGKEFLFELGPEIVFGGLSFGLLVEDGPDISKVSKRDTMFAQVKCCAVVRDVILFTDKCPYYRGVLGEEKRLGNKVVFINEGSCGF